AHVLRRDQRSPSPEIVADHGRALHGPRPYDAFLKPEGGPLTPRNHRSLVGDRRCRNPDGMTSDTDLITTPFGFEATAAEVIDGVDLADRRAIVTGASSGIGIETARALASAGAAVTLAVRNVEAGAKVADGIGAGLPPGSAAVQVARLDLADPASVATIVHEWNEPLHILVNNAGVMALPQLARTAAGYEMQFATNH